jgi:hypothetical protein
VTNCRTSSSHHGQSPQITGGEAWLFPYNKFHAPPILLPGLAHPVPECKEGGGDNMEFEVTPTCFFGPLTGHGNVFAHQATTIRSSLLSKQCQVVFLGHVLLAASISATLDMRWALLTPHQRVLTCELLL